jgi:transketolase
LRSAFIYSLLELAQRDDRVTLVVGDLGFGVVTRFAEELPKQFVNAGVAEQNMTGLATGMALNGKIVFTYSIANFPVLRCLEQIRNDVCYHQANVKIVAVGGGMAYGSLGMSHHATEDIAIMRALPNMVVIAPNDPIESALATRAVAAHDGPCYLRLGRAGEPVIHNADLEFQIGKAITIRDGHDVTLLVTGGLLGNVLAVSDLLRDRGVHARVLSVPTIKPLDEEAVLQAARETNAIFTIEEHSVIGGLGGAVSEVLMEGSERRVRFKRIGLNSVFASRIGSQDYLRAEYGLDTSGILATVSRTLGISASVNEVVEAAELTTANR